MISRPCTSAGSSARASFISAIGPSYSSAMGGAGHSPTVGPLPRAITQTGICTDPQALSLRECGTTSVPNRFALGVEVEGGGPGVENAG